MAITENQRKVIGEIKDIFDEINETNTIPFIPCNEIFPGRKKALEEL